MAAASVIPTTVKVNAFTGMASASVQPIRVAGRSCVVRLLQVRVKFTSGTAANFTARVFNSAASATPNDFSQVYVSANTGVATLLNDKGINSVFTTDANGFVYMTLAPSAGADNAFSVETAFEIRS